LITLLGYKVDDTGRDQYNKGIDQTKQKQQSLTASFLKANIIMGVAQKALGAAFSFVKDSVIGATAETERYRVTLGTMMGDQEKANKIIHDLDYSPLSDFYGTANAIGGLQGMVTFGMQAEEASGILTRLGDVAQGNSEAFVTMSNNMGQVFANGKASANNLKAFVNQGFDVVGEVARQTGKSREEITKTGVTYAQTKAALESLTNEGGKYNQMLAKQMNTLGGVIKQFNSFKAATAEAIGFGINDDLKDMLKYILEIAKAGQDAFVGKFVKFLKEVIHWIFQVIIMWEVLGYRLEDMGAFDVIGGFFADLKAIAGQVLTGIMKLVVSVGKVFFYAFKTAYTALRPALLALGELVQKVLNFFAVGVQGLIPVINMLKVPLTIIGGVLAVIIKGLGGIIDFLTPLAPIIIGIIAIIKIWTLVQWLLNAAMMANPIGLIVVAVIAAVALIVGLVMVIKNNWSKIADFFINLWEGIKNIFSKAFNFLKDLFFKYHPIGILIKNWDKVADFFSGLWDGIKNVAGKAWEGIKTGASKAGEFLKNNWKTIAVGMVNPWAGGLKALYDHNEKFRNFVDNTWGKIKGVLGKVWDKMPDGAKNVFLKIRDIISAVIDEIKVIINGIKEFFVGLWGALKQGPAATFAYLKESFKRLIAYIIDLWKRLLTVIKKVFQSIAQAARTVWNGMVSVIRSIGDKIKNIFTGLVDAIKGIWNTITGWFASLWEGIVNTARSIWDGLKSVFTGLVNSIKSIWNGIIGFFSGLWEAMKQGPTAAIEYIKNAFIGLFNSLQEKLLGFINKIKEVWNGVKGFFGGAVEGIGNFFTGGNQMQPAYAGVPQNPAASRVGQTSNYAYNNARGGDSTVNANTNINVNVPKGTPQEQSEAIARQIDAQFNAKLSSSINSSRANIPSPEVRRK